MLEEKDLQALAQLIDIKLEPINSRLDHLEQSLTEVKTLATKTQVLLENDIAKKIDSLYEGHQLNREKLDVVINKLDSLETDMLANEIITKSNVREINELKRKAQ